MFVLKYIENQCAFQDYYMKMLAYRLVQHTASAEAVYYDLQTGTSL